MFHVRLRATLACAIIAFAAPATAAVTFEYAAITAASTADTLGFQLAEHGDYAGVFDYAVDGQLSEASSLPTVLNASSYAAAVSPAAVATGASNNSFTFTSAAAGRVSFSGTASASMTFDPPPEIGFSAHPYAWAYNGVAILEDYPLGLSGHYAAYRFTIDAPVLLSLAYDVSLSSDVDSGVPGILSFGINNQQTGFYAGDNLLGPNTAAIFLTDAGTYDLAVYGGYGQYGNDSAHQETVGAQNLFYNAFFAFDMQAVTPVPEPAEWAMLVAGLGLVGRIARRRA